MRLVEVLLHHYRNAGNHVAKRLSDDGLRSEAGCVRAANKTEYEVSYFLRKLDLSMEDCADPQITHPRDSVDESSSKVLKILWGLKNKLLDIASIHYVFDEGPMNRRHIILSCDILYFCFLGSMLLQSAILQPCRRLIKLSVQAGHVCKRTARLRQIV